MKKTVLILLTLVLLSTPVIAGAITQQKFETTFTIVFNEITLEEASQLEKRIKRIFRDACKIEVELDKVEQEFITIYTDDTTPVWDFDYIDTAPVNNIN